MVENKFNPFSRNNALAAMMGNDSETGYNLIDFSQIALATILHTYEPTDNLELKFVRHLILDTIRYNVMRHKDNYPNVVLCVDNREGYWRKKVASYYKCTRKKVRDKKEWDWDKINEILIELVDEFEHNLPYKLMNVKYCEADDVIGTLAVHLTKQNHNVLITSSDSDFTQLHDLGRVKQWSPAQKKWVTPKHGSPYRDLLVKIIKGDAKDSIANIRSDADFYLQKMKDEDLVIRQPPISGKFLAECFASDNIESLLNENMLKRFNENKKLLDLKNVPVKIQQLILERFENQPIAPRSKLFHYFSKNELTQLAQQTQNF
ncbi:putative RnaseH [Vibrio phage vB_VmeM-32]|nr:putative RnaseH [Vibrio phage vB_VmeM-32]